MSKNNYNGKKNTKQQPYNVRGNKGPSKSKAPVRKMYTKTCANPLDLFNIFMDLEDEVITEIINPAEVAPESKELLNNKETVLREMEKNIVEYAMLEEIPDITTKENIHTSLLVKPNKLAFQTNHFIGFGWTINTERPTDKDLPATITSIDAFVTLSGYKTVNEKESVLLENGWEVSEN